MTRWTRRILFLDLLLGLALVCYLYADTIMGWFPLLSQYPAPCALLFVYTVGQWEVAIRGPRHRRSR